ncbi:CoA-binding protein [Blastocladiella britannica]|nr:CoA-binding protein [Blastocladiella britannica]
MSIATFLAAPRFAVVGASVDRSKFGNRVLRYYLAHGKPVVPVNPKEATVEGVPAVAALTAIPATDASDTSVSIITPPAVTRRVLDDAVAHGFVRFWLQPGAEFPGWQEYAAEKKVAIIAGGPCVLVDAKL